MLSISQFGNRKERLVRDLETGVIRRNGSFVEEFNPDGQGSTAYNPQGESLVSWNRIFFFSCIVALYLDCLFFFVPVLDHPTKCLTIDRSLAISATTLRTINDAFYTIRLAFQFQTANVIQGTQVFGYGKPVIDSRHRALHYMKRYFLIDLLSIVPLPQFLIWIGLLQRSTGLLVDHRKILLYIVLLQYVPRFLRLFPLFSGLKRVIGLFSRSPWGAAAYNLLLYLMASHIVGALYFFWAVERTSMCWKLVCMADVKCKIQFINSGRQPKYTFNVWSPILEEHCNRTSDSFDFGIYERAVSSGIVSSKPFASKYFYSLWWGLQNLSTLGQGLETSTFPLEIIFSISIAIFGLILFALLIGNMQTHLQSLTIRLEEKRPKAETERWMHCRRLPESLRAHVRQCKQYRKQETGEFNEEDFLENLPTNLRRDIKHHCCLDMVRRVPVLENMDPRLHEAISQQLKPCLYSENSCITREGDLVDEMRFIVRGQLLRIDNQGDRRWLSEGDLCGEELLLWASDTGDTALPFSTSTVRALTGVEVLTLKADEFKLLTHQFCSPSSRNQMKYEFRCHSQAWRTWAARYIQDVWHRYAERKSMERQRKEEDDGTETEEIATTSGN